MELVFDERLANSSLAEMIWHTHSERAATKAYTGEGSGDLGRGMGQGGGSDRLGEAHAAERLLSATEEVDSRADVLLVEPKKRMSKDYERLCASAEAFVYAAMIRMMVRRSVRT